MHGTTIKILKNPPFYSTDIDSCKQCGSRNICIHHATKDWDV
jgi:hypothetical protein